jgi:hypothetical protein
MDRIINRLTHKPKLLFLVDAIGAFLTAFFLLAILRPFDAYFGMPTAILTYLSIIAGLFCLYSLTCFFLVIEQWRPFLRAIAIANLLYACLTFGLVVYYYDRLTLLGIVYFLAEILIICWLVWIELKAIKARGE